MFSVLFTIAFGVTVVGIGWPVVRYLDSGQRLLTGERFGTAFLIGCLPVYFLVELVGYFRLDLISVGALAAFSALLALPGICAIPWRTYVGNARTEMQSSPLVALLLATTVLVGLITLLQGLAPPNDYDSINYHLAFPRYDIELGRKGIPWDRQIGMIFLPALGGNMTRIALLLADDGAAQMIHGLFSAVAALGASMLVIRLGHGRVAAILAALMFLSIRSVVWQMATVETDYLLAAAIIFCLTTYLVFRTEPDNKIAVLFGLLLGAAVLIKLSAFVFAAAIAPLMLFDLVRRRRISLAHFLIPMTTLVVIGPHLIKTGLLTGNPLYPMLPGLLAPERLANTGIYETFEGLPELFGTGRGIVDLLGGPWFISVQPMHYFDGMVLGTPYLLMLCPFVFADKRWRAWLPVISVAFVFYVFWFYGLSQQVRFLTQIGSILAACAAVGLVSFWTACRDSKLLKVGFVAICGILVMNQGMFVGIYAVLRLPVAIGMISDEVFLNKTPNLTNSHFTPCEYIRKNIRPGEVYFSNTGSFLSYYCPQAQVVRNYFPDESKWWLKSRQPPAMSLNEFYERSAAIKFRYFMVTTHSENRRNVTAKAVIRKQDASEYRFGSYLAPILGQLEPLSKDSFTAVYDGKDVIRLLKSQAAKQRVTGN